MDDKILIIEDQLTESDNLRITLEAAGFLITGIATSVPSALELVKAEKPDMVLLNISLNGNLNDAHLAKIFGQERIPFIYLSENSNPATLEEAKATYPYGFLLKPYTKMDILATLDIALYQYRAKRELIQRQEHWLTDMLQNILSGDGDRQKKLMQIAQAFEPIIPMSYMLVDLNLRHETMSSVWLFERTDSNYFKPVGGWDLLDKLSITSKTFNRYRKEISVHEEIFATKITDMNGKGATPHFLSKLKNSCEVLWELHIPLPCKMDSVAFISFFSIQQQAFNNDHIGFARAAQPLLTNIIGQLVEEEENNNLAGKSYGEVQANKRPIIEGVVGNSQKLLNVLSLVGQVAPVDTTVLISGETGTGKEGLANAIHELSSRKSGPFIKINCAAIPANLIEAELFGHERGSYTGATERRIGKFEQAQGGTIFLDEVGEIPFEIQSKLLRVLQEKELERIGGRSTIKLDVRIIAATNRNLYVEVATGRFRIDLYYRLNVFPISLPPLRERKEDIPLLVNYFLQQIARSSGERPKRFSPAITDRLLAHNWPGNIRELQNLIERQVLMATDIEINVIDLPVEELVLPKLQKLSLRQAEEGEKERIEAALEKAGGKISGTGGAAAILNLTPAILTSRMRKLGVVWTYKFQ